LLVKSLGVDHDVFFFINVVGLAGGFVSIFLESFMISVFFLLQKILKAEIFFDYGYIGVNIDGFLLFSLSEFFQHSELFLSRDGLWTKLYSKSQPERLGFGSVLVARIMAQVNNICVFLVLFLVLAEEFVEFLVVFGGSGKSVTKRFVLLGFFNVRLQFFHISNRLLEFGFIGDTFKSDLDILSGSSESFEMLEDEISERDRSRGKH